MNPENKMQEIGIEKVTVNMGVGPNPEDMKAAQKIIEKITGKKSVQTKCKIKQPKWNIRPGLPIGLKVTLRNQDSEEFLKKALSAKDNRLSRKNFDNRGNFGFGIHEYIDLPGIKYDPALGVRGLDVLVTLKRPGYRIKRRKIKPSAVGKGHQLGRDNAIEFMVKKFGVVVE
ncbi:MAG: 50S ribosomal protein L5 [Candidatus Diapherotrites archaeon]|uniref:50S ribosomal protein L5 n=1 Tax=Candidatus Iainarchaeum sp. TaxID=3101447 RepID=A0A938YME4_9ARCH|nr:50S ribosomal protein L5 [Candidatus Diapherotrites archaeon]